MKLEHISVGAIGSTKLIIILIYYVLIADRLSPRR